MSKTDKSDFPVDEAPAQYRVGELCKECRLPLSRYNPYIVCGPCRVRICTNIVDDYEEDDPRGDDGPGYDWRAPTSYVWERFPRRVEVRRGSLLECAV